MTLLTGFKALLFARSGCNDICVATTVANRCQPPAGAFDRPCYEHRNYPHPNRCRSSSHSFWFQRLAATWSTKIAIGGDTASSLMIPAMRPSAWEGLRRQPRPGIPHPDAHAFLLVGFRTDLQFAPAVTVAAHRLDDQVVDHLLNLHPIAPKERQKPGELRLNRDADLNDLTSTENDRGVDRFIYVEPIHLRRRFLM